MSNHKQSHEHPASVTTKSGDCCGGAHDHESAKPDTHEAGQPKKPSTVAAGSHAHSSHGAGGSCGCGGKHK